MVSLALWVASALFLGWVAVMALGIIGAALSALFQTRAGLIILGIGVLLLVVTIATTHTNQPSEPPEVVAARIRGTVTPGALSQEVLDAINAGCHPCGSPTVADRSGNSLPSR